MRRGFIAECGNSILGLSNYFTFGKFCHAFFIRCGGLTEECGGLSFFVAASFLLSFAVRVLRCGSCFCLRYIMER